MSSNQPAGLVLAATALVFAAALAAQSSQPNPSSQSAPQFRSGVDLVHLDVSVLDRDRRPVKALTAADFTVLEDGKPQPVAAFSEVDLPDPPPPRVAWMRDIPSDVKRNSEIVDRRLVVLVMDDATIPFEQAMIKSAREIGRLAVERLGPNDLACVVFTRDNRNAQEFTNDRSRLLNAIDAFQFGGRSVGLMADARDSPGLIVAELTSLYASVDTLRRVAETLTVLPQRRKAVIYVTVGVPADLTSSAEVVIAAPGRPAAGEIGAAMRRIFDYMSETYRQAQRANVNVYTVSPAGVGGMEQLIQSERWKGRFVPPYETPANYFDFLVGVAENTGGRAFPDRNEFGTALTSIFQENSSYYLLGYQPPNPALDGKYRRVEVKVNSPGLTVRTRSGYYNAKARVEAASAAAPLTAALSGLLPKTDVPLDVVAAPFAIPGKAEVGVAIVLTVHENLPARSARTVEDVELQVTAFTQEGVQRGSSRLNAKVTMRAGPAGPAAYEVLSQITLKPGRYQLWLSAKTRGQTGSVYYDIDVPDFGVRPLSISGLALSSDPRPAVSSSDPVKAFMPIAPTARREFSVTDKVTAFAKVYQGGRDPLTQTTVTVKIIDATGFPRLNQSQLIAADRSPVGSNPLRPVGAPSDVVSVDRSIDFRMDLPLRTLPAGEYLLTLEAATPRGQAQRHVRFRVK